ncbi:PepSY-associated TM helix domain-containing protein [Amycolatopsis tucumanensis]|uniref:PepSY domain-containing protein n=1 Tax=Amycolatopsis tucumanensis TaxID=401106 RepID=A0ABP7HXA2_9PSEU|nr:PepSY domain-containing protein [Amycolatopsis tucumanensis]MCF6424888.1 PepSY domain-containing protein [Amycolatopsis tucumanensis]
MSTTTETRTPGKRKKQPARGMNGLRVIARRVHFMAGIVVSPFLVVLSLTGLVYVFSPQIHDNLYHSQLYVNEVGAAPKPVSEQVRAAMTAHPEAVLRQVITSPEPDRTTRVVLSVPGLAGTDDAGQARTVFVDPYTGYINGELTTAGNRMPANTWLRDLHSNLHLGEPGRWYAELCASWLPVIVLGGLVLWLAQSRRRTRTRDLFVPPRKTKGGWLRLRGLHGPLGLWLSAGLVVIAVSGLLISQFTGGRGSQDNDPMRLRAPTLVAAPVAVPEGVEPIGVDRVLEIAQAQGLHGELLVTAPARAGAVYTVMERAAGIPLQRDNISVDPFTGEVTEHIGWDDYSFLAKLTSVAAEFHTGTLFGLANQIVLAVLVTGLLVLIGLGYRMWWVRSPYKGKWKALPTAAWKQLSLPMTAAGFLGIVAITWVLPVFGASLLVFLAVDAAISALQRRKKPVPRAR